MKQLWAFPLVLWMVGAAPSIPILLNKCCPSPHDRYDMGHNECKEVNDSFSVVDWPPPTRSLRNNQTLTNPDFHVGLNLVNCSESFVVHSTADFILYEDGYLKALGFPSIFSPGEFCLDHSLYEELHPGVKFAARFCLPDPCAGINCVLKCCPHGYMYDMERRSCERSLKPFLLKFSNESVSFGDISSDSYAFRYGRPVCPNGRMLLDPSEYEEDRFHVLPSGQLHIPENPEDSSLTNQYCVEDFLVDNRTVTNHLKLTRSKTSIDQSYLPQERKAFICFPDQLEPPHEEKALLKVYPAFMLISALFLIATFVVYAIIPELRNIHGATIMCHSISLATTYICLGIIQLFSGDLPIGSCIFIAITTHFTFLAAFSWLNVMSFDIWWTLTDFRPRSSIRHSGNRIGHRFVGYSLYAWGVPFIIVLVGVILDNTRDLPENVLRPEFGVSKCWFSNKKAMLAYFYGPIGAILLSNLLFFIMTAIRLHRARKETAFATRNQKKKKNYAVIISLFLLMGVTWITEIITWSIEGSAYYAIPTDILNILTGVFIFIIFVCKKKVRRLLVKKWICTERFLGRHATVTITSSGNQTTFSLTERENSQRDKTAKKAVTVTDSLLSGHDADKD